AMATVFLREDSVTLRLAREKLSGILYKHLSPLIYMDFAREYAPELAVLSDQELLDYFQNQEMTDHLFDFAESGEAMELGAAACLVNTAIASADDPVRMAAAFRAAVEAGRNAWLAGAGAVRARGAGAEASSPLTGFLR
ncbi:MAG: hypothetical protein Q4F27_05150, partial [Desulfovibrionaceae bacterium]|nr:hypothetical protein [Desulfovibrionaceae bacterium]